jgi:hypothetical protein
MHTPFSLPFQLLFIHVLTFITWSYMYCLFADCIRFERRRRASCCGRRQGCCVCNSSFPVGILSRFVLLKLGCSQGDIHARGIAGYSCMLIPPPILCCLQRVYIIPPSYSTHSHAHIRAHIHLFQPALPFTCHACPRIYHTVLYVLSFCRLHPLRAKTPGFLLRT